MTSLVGMWRGDWACWELEAEELGVWEGEAMESSVNRHPAKCRRAGTLQSKNCGRVAPGVQEPQRSAQALTCSPLLHSQELVAGLGGPASSPSSAACSFYLFLRRLLGKHRGLNIYIYLSFSLRSQQRIKQIAAHGDKQQ